MYLGPYQTSKMELFSDNMQWLKAFTIEKRSIIDIFLFFFNCYLATPQPTFNHYRGDSFTHPMLITAFLHFSAQRSPGAL